MKFCQDVRIVSHTLLLKCEIVQFPLLKKVNFYLPCNLVTLLFYLPKRIECLLPYQTLYTNVHNSFICNR